MRSRRGASALLALALALGACTGGDAVDDPTPSETASAESPSPTPTASAESPSEIDVTTIPDEITEEYVQAVLDEVAGSYNAAVLMALDLTEFPQEPTDFPAAIFQEIDRTHDGGQLTAALQGLLIEAGPEGRSNLADPFEGYQYRVMGWRELAPRCLAVEVGIDISGVVPDPAETVRMTTMLLRPPEEPSAPGLPLQLVSQQAEASEGDFSCG